MRGTVINAQTGEVTEIEEEITQEEIDEIRIKEIDYELKEIDKKGITRALEDVIDKTNILNDMYESTKEEIKRKQELREERKNIIENKKGGV